MPYWLRLAIEAPRPGVVKSMVPRAQTSLCTTEPLMATPLISSRDEMLMTLQSFSELAPLARSLV